MTKEPTDSELFKQAMRGVKPLKKGHLVAAKPLRTQKELCSRSFVPIAPSPRIALSLPTHYDVQAESVISFHRPHFPHRRLKELRDGKITWQNRLDLHGLRPEEAEKALVKFLESAQQQEQRCILVIHGKGSRQGEPPILKNLVYHWLPQFPQVLAFHSAPRQQGGVGALYVLLKNSRKQT